MQSKQFLSSSLPFTVSLFVLLYERVECPNWVTGQRLDSWQVQWARVNTSLYIACFFFFFVFSRPFRSTFSEHLKWFSPFLPPLLHSGVLLPCACFCLLSVHGVSRLTCWNGAPFIFFLSLFPSHAEAGKERYCVRTCLCEAFPNSLRNLSANKASFFWLTSRQSVQQCFIHYTQVARRVRVPRSARSELVHTTLRGSRSYCCVLFACASVSS